MSAARMEQGDGVAAPSPRGALAALYTPFRADGGIDDEALRALCRRQIDAGVGLVPCGTTGETPALTKEEDFEVIRVAAEMAEGRVPVVAGTGSNDTRTAVQNTRHARELGADATLSVVPYYNKPPRVSLYHHFREVAREGGLPVIVYNIPGRTGCHLPAEDLLELAREGTIVGVKEASARLDQFQKLVDEAPDGLSVLAGDDVWTLPNVLLGGHGVISVAANVVPRAMAALVEAAGRGDVVRARSLQHELLPLFRGLFATTNPIPVKRAAALLGHARADMRLPLSADAMDEARTEELRAALERARAAVGEE